MKQQTETKAVETLRRVQRDADQGAREAIREASRLIEFANHLAEQLREMTEAKQ